MMPYITIADIPVRSYVIFLFLGALLLVLFILFKEIPAGKEEEPFRERLSRHFWELVLLSAVLGIIGARLVFVLVHQELFVHKPWWVALAFWRGGLTFHGGLIMVLLAGVLFCRWRRIPLGRLLDMAAPYMAAAYAVGRIGCLFNGCCYGHPTELPWGLIIPAVDDFSRHPTQLYASLLSLAVFFILQRVKHSSYFPGYVFAWFLILHSGSRFLVEFFRVSPPFLYNLSLAQVFTAALAATGLLVLLWQRKKSSGGAADA